MSLKLQYTKCHEIYVGTQVGIFKKCITNKREKDGKLLNEISNLKDVTDSEHGHKITAVAWTDLTHTDILVAQDDGRIKIYNTVHSQFTTNFKVPNLSTPIIGLTTYKGLTTTVTGNGELKIWKSKTKILHEIDLGGNITAISHSIVDDKLLASAGKENCVKIWDLEKKSAVFTAKNEPNDSLQLAVPVWESGLTFMPGNSNLIVSCSRYGKVRLYDHRAQRRPIIIVDTGLALTTVSPCYKERKDTDGMTDDTKQQETDESEWYSHLVIQDLSRLDLTEVLLFMGEVCGEGRLRDWFGKEGSVFWQPFLCLLCHRRPQQSFDTSSGLTSQPYSQLETATIRYLSKVTACHPDSQQILATVIATAIASTITQNVTFLHGISGFTRRLVLQLLLENEKLLVSVRSPAQLMRIDPTAVSVSYPALRPGSHHQLFSLSTHTSCEEIMKQYVSYFRVL